MPLPLTDIFPDEDYRFHLTLRQATAGEFFRDADPASLAERRRWIAESPQRYVAAELGAARQLEDFERAAASWTGYVPLSERSDRERLVEIGSNLEPDILLLARSEGVFRLVAGVVCFPSSWALEEKVGRPLAEIHGPVPGLNGSLGAAIDRFFDRLKPGVALERANWGLAATPERNLHPALQRRLLPSRPRADEIWVRIEDQLLTMARATVVFGIRLRILPLTSVLADAAVRTGLERALRTMSAEVAAYKGLTPARDALLGLLAPRP